MPMKGLALIMVGMVMALVAQFALEGWADLNDLGHWVQHGLTFWGGIVVGWGCVLLYWSGRLNV